MNVWSSKVKLPESQVLIYQSSPEFASNALFISQQFESAGITVTISSELSAPLFIAAIEQMLTVGPVVIVDARMVTGQAVIESLAKPISSCSILLKKETEIDVAREARVLHKKVTSAASAIHRVTGATHQQLGAIRIAPSREVELALDQTSEFSRTSNVGTDVISLVTVGLIRSSVEVSAMEAFGVSEFAASAAEVSSIRDQVNQQNEESVRLTSALRSNDGFYSTFVLRKISRLVTRIAIARGWTPNQITLSSLAIAAIATGLFATGKHSALVAGALLVQLSIIVDCSDGEVARYTNVSSKLGAWLDAATDRIKEYAIYAGLAYGAVRNGYSLWALAGLVLVMQTVRHLSDYNFVAVQSARETFVPKYSLSHEVDSGSINAGAVLATSSKLNQQTRVRWAKRVIYMPIGERWLLISIGALIGSPTFVFWSLLITGLIGLTYVSIGRYLRARTWSHPQEISGCDILERQLDASRFVEWFMADISHPLKNRFSWAVPAVLRFVELGFLLAVSYTHPIGYLWLFAVAYHHYDNLYRSLSGHEAPAWIRKWGMGFDLRMVLVAATMFGFIVSFDAILLVGGLYFTILFVGLASWQWVTELQNP